jgi:transposase-like protein
VTEQELTRRAKRRLAILRHAEEITGNVALTCRYYGISRQVFYKWRQRYEQHGLDGDVRDRAAVPTAGASGRLSPVRQPWLERLTPGRGLPTEPLALQGPVVTRPRR